MKLIIVAHKIHAEVHIQDDAGINIHTYVYDDLKQAKAFCSGFLCGKYVASNLIQSLPLSYEIRRQPGTPEDIGEQLSKQWVGKA